MIIGDCDGWVFFVVSVIVVVECLGIVNGIICVVDRGICELYFYCIRCIIIIVYCEISN